MGAHGTRAESLRSHDLLLPANEIRRLARANFAMLATSAKSELAFDRMTSVVTGFRRYSAVPG